MRRVVYLAAVAVTGAVVGMTVPSLADRAAERSPIDRVPATQAPVKPVDEPAGQSVLLVWGPGGLPVGLADRLAAHPEVTDITLVRAGVVGLQASIGADGAVVDAPPAGAVIPLDAMAFDADTYPAFVPASVASAFRHLAAGETILGDTSARLRRLGVGDRLVVAGGVELTVAAIVDDTLIGAAEIALPAGSAGALRIDGVRYALVAYGGDRAGVEAAARSTSGSGPLRIRAPGESPFLRHGDAVLPQVLLKERFGEFAYYPGEEREFVQDPSWQAENLARADVPLLGPVRCHRSLLTALTGAMSELQERNLGHLVNREAFAGCWNPRLVVAGGDVSRHAWGVALDINWGKNPTGLTSVQDERLVETMERWGFTWGGRWLVPDPAHFEYLRPPDAGSA